MSIIYNIIEMLKEKGLKQADLCSYLEINTSTFATWKNRDTDPPAKYIMRICEFLSVSPYQLLGDTTTQYYLLSSDEEKLISFYRSLDEYSKGVILGEAKAMASK